MSRPGKPRCVCLPGVPSTSLQVSGVRSWWYPRARKLALPPLIMASCFAGELGARTAWFGSVFVRHSPLWSAGGPGWLRSRCGFGSCRQQAPAVRCAAHQRPRQADSVRRRGRGELRSRCSSAKEGAANRRAACVVGLWRASSLLPVEARGASNLT